MAVSDVDLANAALGYLGRDIVRDLDGNTPAAVQLRPRLNEARQEFIEEFDWPQSRAITTLTRAVGVAAPSEWSQVFVYPSDAIVVWRLTAGDKQTINLYELGMSGDVSDNQTYIFTNSSGLSLRYASSRATLERFSPKQFDLIARRLAIKACMPITKDVKLRDYLEKTYKTDLNSLKTHYANLEPEIVETEEIPELIAVRSR